MSTGWLRGYVIAPFLPIGTLERVSDIEEQAPCRIAAVKAGPGQGQRKQNFEFKPFGQCRAHAPAARCQRTASAPTIKIADHPAIGKCIELQVADQHKIRFPVVAQLNQASDPAVPGTLVEIVSAQKAGAAKSEVFGNRQRP